MPVHKQVRRHRPSPGLQRRGLCDTASFSCSHESLSDDSNEGSSAPQRRSTEGNFSMGMMVKKYFQGHGWCNGKIVSYRNYAYQIQFRIENITTECSAAPAELKRLRSTASIREGACLEVYWPAMKAYKQAVVRRENSRKRENFLVSYVDSPAEREWIDLQRHRFRVVDQKPAAEVVVPSSISARNSPILEVPREVSAGSDEGSLQMFTMGQTIPDTSSSISFSDCAGSSAGTRISAGTEVPPALESEKSAGIQTSEDGKDDVKATVTEAKYNLATEHHTRSSTETKKSLKNAKSLVDDFASVRSNSSTNTSNQSTIPSSNVKKLLKCDTANAKRKRPKASTEYVAVSPVTRNNLAERRKLKSEDDIGVNEDFDGVVIDPVSDRATRSLVNSLIAVGSRVSVFLENEGRFFSGTITDFRTRGEPFFISYDDGDEEWIDLRSHKFRILGMGNPRRHSNSRSTRDDKKQPKKRKKLVQSKEIVEDDDAPFINDDTPEDGEDELEPYTATSVETPMVVEEEKKPSKRKRASLSGGTCVPSESNISRLSIGSRIAVWWSDDEHYYIGSVKKERVHKEPYFIVYDDDDEGEWLDLKDHKFKIMPNEPPEQKKRGRRKKDEGLNPNDVDRIRVGSHVAVWWNNVSQYLKGRITKQRDHERPFYISYDMGQPGHWIDLSKYTFRLVDRGSDKGDSTPNTPVSPKKSPARRGSDCSSGTDMSSEIRIGSRVSVYWEGDDTYYEGVVTREKKSGTKRHFVEYDDGEAAHWIDFNDHWVRILHKSGKETPRKREKGAVSVSEFDKRCRPKKQNDDLLQLQVGSRVEIWWTGDNCFYRGQITRKSKKHGKFFVLYEDGSDEWVNLRRQEFRLIGDDSSGDEGSHDENTSENDIQSGDEQAGEQIEESNEFYKYSDFVYGAVEEVKQRTRISVWWTAEKRYFDCVVQEIDKSSRKPYFLVYDDGDEEWTDLRRRYFRFLR